MLSHKGYGWKKCVVESDWKAKEGEEKSFTCNMLGYFHPVVTLWFWQSSLQDGLSCNECSITQARWSRCGLSIWDQKRVELLGSPWVLTHTTGYPRFCGGVVLSVTSVPAWFIWIHRGSWSSPTHHQPPSCHLTEICFHWVWGSDVKYKLPIWFISV